VNGLAFSADGRRIASAGDDGTVHVWDPDTGQEALILKGHADAVTSAAFRPDGELIVSVSSGAHGLVWEAPSHYPPGPGRGPPTESPPNQGREGEVPTVGPGASEPRFAPNLGIYYEVIRYTGGTFGARLTRYPVPGSPAAQLRLKPGDIIGMMDELPFRSHQDVLNHKAQTSILFINVRSGKLERANV
jgi:hypothetical protein